MSTMLRSRVQASKATQALLTVANELALPAMSPKFDRRVERASGQADLPLRQ
jgi:hypothetical protein